MEIKLHFNATTTPKVRDYIQKSTKSDTELAEQFGVSLQTIKKWRNRSSILDLPHTPHTINRRLSIEQEALIVYLRLRLNLSLDELLQAGNTLINQKLSRAVLARTLKKAQINRIAKESLPKIIGETSLDIIQLPSSLSKQQNFLLVLTEKLTGFISFALLDKECSRLENIINYYQTMLPYSIVSIEGCAHPIINKICHSLSIPQVKKEASTQLTHYFKFFSQEKDFTEILRGEYTDPRLGIDALLLVYEDYLNTILCRTKLNKQPPIIYLQSYNF